MCATIRCGARLSIPNSRWPSTADRLPTLLVDHDDVDLGVIDLNNLERPAGNVLARCRFRCAELLRVTAATRSGARIDFQNYGFDRAPSGRHPTFLAVTLLHMLDEVA